jgi:imidazoleglycerol-phosphate dehydratase
MNREAIIQRRTAETDISLQLMLEGTGKADIATGNAFFDHMLTLFVHHGRFDLELSCNGDIEVDFHHSCEDIGICLGRAFAEALGTRAGIKRYGWIMLPMDEALIQMVVDISGRGVLCFDATTPSSTIGSFDTELVQEFWLAFSRELRASLHIKKLAGCNSHHIIEGIFKAAGRVLAEAVAIDSSLDGAIPSTKGTII